MYLVSDTIKQLALTGHNYCQTGVKIEMTYKRNVRLLESQAKWRKYMLMFILKNIDFQTCLKT